MKISSVGLRRLVALGVDWLVIVLWGGMLLAAVMALSDGRGPNIRSPWIAQGIGFVSMTVPVTLYFVVSESSRWRASVGKRLLRLSVTTTLGQRMPWARSLLRNTVKFIPWECGHMVAQQAIYAGHGQPPVWVWGFAAVSLALPLVWVVTALLRNRTPYDAWSEAVVRVR
jgi:uncharacterized RDD family membrane protein YckC